MIASCAMPTACVLVMAIGSVSAPDSSLTLGDPAIQATVVARDAANNILSLTGRTVAWTSSNIAAATVSASGLLTAVGAGSSTIGVTVDGVGPATFTLTVAPIPVASDRRGVFLQLGAFGSRANAESLGSRIQRERIKSVIDI